MYRSPIEIIYGEIEAQFENEVLKAVQRIGVNVNKEELLKALQYDREQYSKGYKDGLNADGWIPCSERLPNCIGVYQVTKEFLTGDRVADCAYFDGQNTWHNDNRVNHGRTYLKNVIAWMPKPEPYKGE